MPHEGTWTRLAFLAARLVDAFLEGVRGFCAGRVRHEPAGLCATAYTRFLGRKQVAGPTPGFSQKTGRSLVRQRGAQNGEIGRLLNVRL
jgi:hypothetical protein